LGCGYPLSLFYRDKRVESVYGMEPMTLRTALTIDEEEWANSLLEVEDTISGKLSVQLSLTEKAIEAMADFWLEYDWGSDRRRIGKATII